MTLILSPILPRKINIPPTESAGFLSYLLALRHEVGPLPRQKMARSQRMLLGAHRSWFRGRGMSFEESRPYQPGDDTRAMDWRVMARTGEPYVKLYQEEKERPVLLVVDLNPSMAFGSRRVFKATAACELAALAGWFAAKRGDRVGGLVITAKRHWECRPLGGERGVLPLLRILAHANPLPRDFSPPSPLALALMRLRRLSRPGSEILLISDFLSWDPSAQPYLSRLAEHANVTVLFIYDPLEESLPPAGLYPFSDGKNILLCHTHDALLRQRFHDAFVVRQETIAKICQKEGVHFSRLATVQTVGEMVQTITMSGLGRRR